MDPRSEIALCVARGGWPPHDILAHGVIDYHPVTVGRAHVHADPDQYVGAILRENLGVPEQDGPDPRLTNGGAAE